MCVSTHRVRYPLAGTIDNSWLSIEWVIDIGLPNLASSMTTHLVDGRWAYMLVLLILVTLACMS